MSYHREEGRSQAALFRAMLDDLVAPDATNSCSDAG